MASRLPSRGSVSGAQELRFRAAFAAALSADRAEAGRTANANSRRRICQFLCHLGGEMEVAATGPADFPIGRADLAAALGISLMRVKRAFGLLALSGVATADDTSIRVTDWRRLCSAAHFDATTLGLEEELADEGEAADSFPWFAKPASDHELQLITGAGDQAFFG